MNAEERRSKAIGRTTAAIANVMKFVCERILELFTAYRRVKVKEDGGIILHIKDETVFSRLNDRVDFSSDVRVFRQVS